MYKMNEDDDFPINSASSKLAHLFNDTVNEDVSFIYNPQPPKPTQKNSPPLSVITGCTVDAFQLKKNGYVSEGKLGLVILGNDELPQYKIYMYRNDENKVASCDIKPNFNLQVQENNYASFQDSNGITWSLHFEKISNLLSFCRELSITKWKSGQNFYNSIKQDGYKGSANHPVTNEDNVEIKIDLFLLENNEKITSCVKEARASSNIWPVNPVGKCLDSVFFMITRSELLRGFNLPKKQIILVEMYITNVIRQHIEEIPKSIIPKPNKHSISPPSQRLEKNPDDEIDKNISERMMKIGYHLPSFQSETGKSSKTSSIAKDEIPGTPSELSFDVSLNSQLNVFLSEVRIGNSEIRMNLNRVNDKVESLIYKVNSCEEMNSKWKPFADKVSSLEDCISSLVEQNQKTISILRQPENKTIIGEVSDLNRKNFILEESLKNANSAIKNLEGKLQYLEDKIENEHNGQNNYLENRIKDLEKMNKDLDNHNSVLNKQVLTLIDEKNVRETQYISALKEKDVFINQMRKSMDLLSGQLNRFQEREIMERDLQVWIKRVLSWADKALKTQLKDLTNNNSLDTVISETLIDVANDFFGRYISSSDRRSRTDSSSEKNSSNEETPNGNLTPRSNPGNPLPKPKPRQIDKTELNNNPNSPHILNELPPLPTITEDEPPMNESISTGSIPENEEDTSFMWKEEPPPLPIESDEESDDIDN